MVDLVSDVITILIALSTGGAFVYGVYTGVNAS
ncbi:Uncharacterised protein [Vibrio anguillarum]|nr:Uncharacterised protein [Vibrio anguillarum]STY58090.1 Uncharacterised protein [Vibrio anguillarum]